MTFAYSMMASRNCALAKYLSPRSRYGAFLASGDLEHPVMTTSADRRRAIHARDALHISVSSVSPIRERSVKRGYTVKQPSWRTREFREIGGWSPYGVRLLGIRSDLGSNHRTVARITRARRKNTTPPLRWRSPARKLGSTYTESSVKVTIRIPFLTMTSGRVAKLK